MKDEAGRPAETGNRKQWLPQQDAYIFYTEPQMALHHRHIL